MHSSAPPRSGNESPNAQAEPPEEQRIVSRIGIDIDDTTIEDGDIYDGGVNIAARTLASGSR